MKSRIRVFGIILFIFLGGIFSCSDKKFPKVSDFSYFPLQTGNVLEFDLERTRYSESQQISHFVTRQLIADSFNDLNDHWVYKIEHDVKLGQETWKTDSITTAWRTTDRLLIQENGRTVVKNTYPITEGLVWDGNCYNTLGEAKFRFTHVGRPFQAGSQFFPNTITVVRQDDSTLLSRSKYVEVYAEHVGLIMTEKIFIQYCSTPDCRGKGVVSSGIKERSVIRNFGK